MRVRAQPAQRLVHRAAPQHDQVRAFLPRFFGDGGDNLADRDAQRQVQSDGFRLLSIRVRDSVRSSSCSACSLSSDSQSLMVRTTCNSCRLAPTCG